MRSTDNNCEVGRKHCLHKGGAKPAVLSFRNEDEPESGIRSVFIVMYLARSCLLLQDMPKEKRLSTRISWIF